MENDLSLLRPFDLDAAKAGEAICYGDASGNLKYAAGPDKYGAVCVLTGHETLRLCDPNRLRMAPLCWVEGKPVYKGDVLWHKEINGKYTAKGFNCGLLFEESSLTFGVGVFTWNPPKVKREGWVNVSKGPLGPVIDMLYDSQERADEFAPSSRISCVRIEWEEPAC